ncbi:unnamed protein product, partial [Owenia fusiformis]
TFNNGQEVYGWVWIDWLESKLNSTRPSVVGPMFFTKHYCSLQTFNNGQEVYGWGWIDWLESKLNTTSASPVDCLCELGGIQDICCAERSMLILTKSNKVFTLPYGTERA